jgi:hypothetical protein
MPPIATGLSDGVASPPRPIAAPAIVLNRSADREVAQDLGRTVSLGRSGEKTASLLRQSIR